MSRYLDTAYVAKCYLNEPDAAKVRALVAGEEGLTSSAWCRAELACVFHRHVREGGLSPRQARQLHDLFLTDVRDGVWSLLPVSTDMLASVERRVRRLRATVFVRAGDAIHLVTAAVAGFKEIWTNDRHLLAAAPAFGLRGRSV
ncbi:MAG: type II toxin-antitoxin system VapC family toxin [Deltaproteobacteria bacterium]|nr:type II toxin-antitoxin system VapC family toxin [Deltaproteobacteria bacterium]